MNDYKKHLNKVKLPNGISKEQLIEIIECPYDTMITLPTEQIQYRVRLLDKVNSENWQLISFSIEDLGILANRQYNYSSILRDRSGMKMVKCCMENDD